MSVKITGERELLKALEEKLGTKKTNSVVNKALRETGDEIVEITKSAVDYYRDSGATYDEVVKSGVKGTASGVKTIDVGWRGGGSRWRLVHLNEFGYTKNGRFIRPQGMGAVQGAVDKSKTVAYKKMFEGLKELAK